MVVRWEAKMAEHWVWKMVDYWVEKKVAESAGYLVDWWVSTTAAR